jgi:DNA-binding IclR family transcriptional regulator
MHDMPPVTPPPGPHRDLADSRSGTQAIDRALSVLDCFEAAEADLALSHVALQADLPVSTTYRILQALTRAGYLHQTDTGYAVGQRVSSLAKSAAPFDLQDASPYLYALAARIKLSVTLGVPDGGSVQTLVTARPIAPWCAAQIPSAREPLHASALGKVVLAFDPDDPRAAVRRLGPLPAFTERTHTSPSALATDVGEVRRAGYALADGERTPGVRAVAVPVFGPGRDMVGAIGIQAMSVRLTNDKVRELLPYLWAVADEIKDRLPRPGHAQPGLPDDIDAIGF